MKWQMMNVGSTHIRRRYENFRAAGRSPKTIDFFQAQGWTEKELRKEYPYMSNMDIETLRSQGFIK